MVNHFTITIAATGTPQRLSTGLSAVVGTPRSGDLLRWLSVQAGGANAGIGYVGGNQRTVSTSDYGYRIEIPTTTIPDAPTVIECASLGSIDDFFIVGTINDTFKILAIT